MPKSLVIDRRTVFSSASLNMQMSARKHFNSELGLVIRMRGNRSPGDQALIDDLSSADGSYPRLSLDASQGHIVWSSGEGSEEKVWHNEMSPETMRFSGSAHQAARPVCARRAALAEGGLKRGRETHGAEVVPHLAR